MIKINMLSLIFVLLVSCEQTAKIEKIDLLYSFPSNLKEISGIYYDSNSKLIWSVEDSGNENEIYALDSLGNIVKTLKVYGKKNVDWEDVTMDEQRNVYVGDFGNNDNTRDDLAVFKISNASLDQNQLNEVEKISFYYPEQKDFPPKKTKLMYDCEGFFAFKSHFYLFTKNRSKNFDGTTLIYKIPNKVGHQKAKLIGKLKLCNESKICAVTSVCISPDFKTVVLLTHEKLYAITEFVSDDFENGKLKEINLNHLSQKEAVSFKNNNTILIADEKVKKLGGNLYEYHLQ